MQPRLTVAIVVLQAEGLVSSSSGCVGFALQFAPTVIIPKPGYRLYRSFHAECRFGRSGSSEFVGGFRRLHWSSCVPLPRVRSCRFALSPALSHERRSRCWDEKSSSNTSLIYINPNKSLNYLIPSTLPKNKEKAKKSFPIFFLLNFLTP